MIHRESRISGMCWNGKHARCTGWLVVPDETVTGRLNGIDQSLACECIQCRHPHVDRMRHLTESPQRGVTYGVH